MPVRITATERICKTCGIEKPIAEFSFPTKKTKSGTTTDPNCKDCRNANARQKRKANPEPFRASDHRRYAKRVERRYQRYREDEDYRKASLERQKRWREASGRIHPRRILTPEERLERTRLRRQRTREAIRTRNRNRKARKKQAEGHHTAKDIQAQYNRQKGKCYYCQSSVTWGKHHVDHVIPLTRGGTNWPDNLVIACPSCNVHKNTKLPHEWAQGGRLL